MNKAKKRYYARIDWFVTAQNPGQGFANSKRIISFSSFNERNKYLLERSDYDFSCVEITYREAVKERYTDYDPFVLGCYTKGEAEFKPFGRQSARQ